MVDTNNDGIADGYTLNVKFETGSQVTSSVIILLCFNVDMIELTNAEFKSILPIHLDALSADNGIAYASLNGQVRLR